MLRRALMGAAVIAMSVVALAPAEGASAYTPVRVPSTSSTEGVQFSDIACWSAGNCVAVGATDDSSAAIAQETHGTWASVDAPLPPNAGATSGALDAVSCPGAGSCIAVGRYGNPNGESGALIETLDDGTWTATAGTTISLSVGLPDAAYAELDDISCASTTSCAAVGTFATSTGPVTGLLDTYAHGTWTPSKATVPLVRSGDTVTNTHLSAVSCPSPGTCTAVGTSDDGDAGYQAGVILTLNAGTWASRAALEPSDGTAARDTLTAVSCAAARCVAIGTYDVYNSTTQKTRTTGMIDESTTSGWSASAAPLPAGTLTVWPRAVSCAGDGTCAIAGYTTGNAIDANNLFPVVITSTGSGWTALPVALPKDAVGPEYIQMSDLATVSCAGATHCVAGGWYSNDTLTGTSGLVVTVSPSAGTATGEAAPLPTDAASSADQQISFSSSTCLDATHCTLLGSYEDDSTIPIEAGLAESSGGTSTAPVPKVTAVSPTAGPTAGGQTVTITGTGLSGATKVTFGSAPGQHLTVVSSTKLTVTTPSHTAGTVDVEVTTAGGTSAVTTADQYTYRATPTVTSLSPTKGSHKGGTKVTVHGTGFKGSVHVKFGSAAGTSVTVTSSTTLTVKAPKHAKGSVNVTVSNAGGTSATSAKDKFKYT